MAIEHPEMSDGAIAATLGVSRQLVSRWRAPVRKAAATEVSESVADEENVEGFAAGQPSAPQPAPPGNALVLALRELDDADQVAVMIDKILRGSAPRAAGIAVGISGKVFARRMETDATFRDLVLRAAHEAESSVAQNLYRLATGASPQAAQSAIAWLEKRMDDWRPGAQRIEVEVSGHVDVAAILASPHLIELENALEAERQRIEDGLSLPAPVGDIIEGELVESRVPADDVRPKLPDDETMYLRESREEVEVGPRRNRPDMPDPTLRGRTRLIMVDGIRTEVQDRRADRDDRPPF